MKLVAAYCYRYEPDWLIDQLNTNLSWVDQIISVNTRKAKEEWVPRERRIATMQKRARAAKATHILHLDPDERIQDDAEPVVREAIDSPGLRFSLRMCELWTPDAYRIDGVWGRKHRRRLYHIDHPKAQPITPLDLNIYHLKMIEPENREERVKVHTRSNTWDNKKRGFDYLNDEKGMVLESVTRPYSPPYIPYSFRVN